MSTKERYGSAVWNAAYDVTYGGQRGFMPLLSVGEIASVAGVSRATAKKYMMDLVKGGHMATFPIGKRWVFQIINPKEE